MESAYDNIKNTSEISTFSEEGVSDDLMSESVTWTLLFLVALHVFGPWWIESTDFWRGNLQDLKILSIH